MDKILIKLSPFQMVCHLALTNCHSLKSQATINCKLNLTYDQKQIFCETHTKKNAKSSKFGKSKSFYYLNESNSPTFDSLDDLLTHYNFKLIKSKL